MSDSILRIQVNKNEFAWNKENGLFKFDEAPALLFWDTAIELFMDAIMEVSGPDVSTTVFEATGFRMGQLVSSYYKDRFDIEEISTEYSDIYRNAGWGNIEVSFFSIVIVRLQNSWEHRILKALDHNQASSHWAGVFAWRKYVG